MTPAEYNSAISLENSATVARTDFASPNTAAEWVALGQRHLAASALAQAAASFERATALEPQVAMHWARLGKVQAAMRQHEAAEAAFAHACTLEPLNPTLQVLRVAQGLRANLEEKRTLLSDLAAQTRAFAVTFRQTGGLLQPLPPARREQARALVGNGVR